MVFMLTRANFQRRATDDSMQTVAVGRGKKQTIVEDQPRCCVFFRFVRRRERARGRRENHHTVHIIL